MYYTVFLNYYADRNALLTLITHDQLEIYFILNPTLGVKSHPVSMSVWNWLLLKVGLIFFFGKGIFKVKYLKVELSVKLTISN